MRRSNDLPPDDRALVHVQATAFVHDVALDHAVNLEVAARSLRGLRDESMEDGFAGALREEVPGHHPRDVAHAVVADEQIAADEAGHRRRTRADHDDGAFEPFVKHTAPEDANHGPIRPGLSGERASRFRRRLIRLAARAIVPHRGPPYTRSLRRSRPGGSGSRGRRPPRSRPPPGWRLRNRRAAAT